MRTTVQNGKVLNISNLQAEAEEYCGMKACRSGYLEN
jgi:hypothetical protein